MLETSLTLADFEPELPQAVLRGESRSKGHVELITFEIDASPLMMAIQDSVPTNKYAEGYPGKHYYSGCEHVDVAERSAFVTAGLRIGTLAVTTRSFGVAECEQPASCLCDVLDTSALGGDALTRMRYRVREQVMELCSCHPVYR